MQYLLYVLAAIVAYFMGGFSIANIISRKVIGKNIDDVGSGNKGASNMIRNCGWPAGLLTLAFDAAKAALAVYVGGLISGDMTGQYIAAVVVICGHIWPLIYKFKGGKGAASTLGAMAFLMPKEVGIIVIVLIIMTLVFKTMSLTSFSGLLLMVVFAFWLHPGEIGIQITTCVILAITIFTHRENIGRLVKGKEAKVKITKSDHEEEAQETQETDASK